MKRALLTIPPTTVEAERVFSAAGLFFTKLRTSLSDRSIDRLMFLRFFLPLKTDHRYFKFKLLYFISFVKFDCLFIVMTYDIINSMYNLRNKV